MPVTVIYGLVDPRTQELRYVGKTSRELIERLRCHLKPGSLKAETHNSHWLRQLKSLSLKPDIFIIEEVPEIASWQEYEQFWIAYYRSIGCLLTNSTPGGEGRKKGSKQSEAAKSKIGAASRKRAAEGGYFTDETRKKMSINRARAGNEKLRGRKQSPETIAARAKAITGRLLSATHREALKRGWEKRRKRFSGPNKGKIASPETKMKMKAAHKICACLTHQKGRT
jgi:hypothetical protein